MASKEDKAEVTYYSRSRITCWSFDGTPCIVLLSRFLKSATENSTLLLSRVDHIYDRKERSRFSSATVVCKLFKTRFLSSQVYFSCIGERMENIHDYVLTSKSEDDKRDMLQPRARRITSWLFDAISYKDF